MHTQSDPLRRWKFWLRYATSFLFDSRDYQPTTKKTRAGCQINLFLNTCEKSGKLSSAWTKTLPCHRQINRLREAELIKSLRDVCNINTHHKRDFFHRNHKHVPSTSIPTRGQRFHLEKRLELRNFSLNKNRFLSEGGNIGRAFNGAFR